MHELPNVVWKRQGKRCGHTQEKRFAICAVLSLVGHDVSMNQTVCKMLEVMQHLVHHVSNQQMIRTTPAVMRRAMHHVSSSILCWPLHPLTSISPPSFVCVRAPTGWPDMQKAVHFFQDF